ncbi:MAG: aspartate 1-decarboxylase [Planctomycetaceae bacterium]|jgi:aspartate 1-decarboxylase|nr:aspartate 1-decarboxylase [Planctomycetaceae bacterium]
MKRTFLKSKIHRATVTQANLDYDGSVSIDTTLLKLADIQPYEQVDIYNISRGTRLTTYAIEAPADSGKICINGAAAHLMQPTDLVIICSYAQFNESEPTPDPIVIKVNEHNAQQN